MSGGGVELRPATEADCPAIAEIYAHHVLNGLASFEIEPPSLDEIARRYAALAGAGFPYVVAVQDDALAGYAYAGPYRPRPAYRFSVEDSVYVAPGRGGQGVGSLLLGRIIEDATEKGFRQMIAVIGDSGNEASIRLHGRHGFERAGLFRDVGFKFGRWVDSVLMTRALGEGAETLPDLLPETPC